ncbi:hypothetical protein PVK06_046931 [Gossypium arboreum]|uniref:Uncharacterized protein n=1 Tax=Gossypium arboreum TaxID=29729 RepID=A0ABR0MDV2_GOSAR|nr:hypothetical protein PVK06_046931 [Gossypium arboreum]
MLPDIRQNLPFRHFLQYTSSHPNHNSLTYRLILGLDGVYRPYDRPTVDSDDLYDPTENLSIMDPHAHVVCLCGLTCPYGPSVRITRPDPDITRPYGVPVWAHTLLWPHAQFGLVRVAHTTTLQLSHSYVLCTT